jgi:hypothetical protein
MRRVLLRICFLVRSVSGRFGQQIVFEEVRMRRHRSAEKRVLGDMIGTRLQDDSARERKFRSDVPGSCRSEL